jgi:hypothetical protein
MSVRRLVACCCAAVTCAALLPHAAAAGWEQAVGGPSPINVAADREAAATDLTSIGGVPLVAWSESDGVNSEVRVARLNAAGDDWTELRSTIVVNGAGINQSDDQDAFNPSIASLGGVPHVAWTEDDGGNHEVRVARLSTALGVRWLQPWFGAGDTSGGINEEPNMDAQTASLAEIGGALYVAWTEFDGSNQEIRVARLNGDIWQQPWTGVTTTYGGVNRSSSASAANPSLADIGGVPYVAWQEGTTDRQIRVSRLDGSTWTEVVGGASPVNHDPDDLGSQPSLASVGGVPHVAWVEFDGAFLKLRVSRLNTGGTDDWEELVGGPNPINHRDDRDAALPSLTGIGPVPYVAWQESDSNSDIRVSRLNAAGTAWEQLVGGDKPVNVAGNRNAFLPSLATVGGLPWVAWDETDGDNREARVARLAPEFGAATADPSADGARLSVQAHTFGLPFPVGFQFGPALEKETTAEPAPTGADDVTITRQIGGLEPSTGHQFRPFATAGTPGPRVLGPTGAFTTTAALGPPPAGASTITSLAVSPSVFSAASRGASIAQRRRVGTRVSYTLSAPATVTFSAQRAAKGRRVGGRCRRPTRRNRARRSCRRFVALRGSFVHAGAAGANSFRFTGRLRGRKLRLGRHRLQARAVDSAGNRSPAARTGFRIVR